MKSFSSIRSSRRDTRDERGAVLALVAGLMVVLMISAALAVDLSALSTRGRSLQNTADAAALAGVAEWVDSGDELLTENVVRNVIRQNGVELSSEVELNIQYVDEWEIEVLLTDNEPDVYFSGTVGIGNDLERVANARFENCDDSCTRVIPIPPPFRAVEALGDGDGFVPVLGEDKVYGLNHHDNNIACISREDFSHCWAAREMFSNTTTRTANNNYAVEINDRIYYAGYDWNNRQGVVGCWNMITDVRCGETRWGGSESTWNWRYGALAEAANGNLYLMSERGAVFCVVPETMAKCGGWWTGIHWTSSFNRNASNGYNARVLAEGNRIFHTLNSYGQWYIQCWDASTNSRCWDARVINNTVEGDSNQHWYNNGWLVKSRDGLGNVTSICSLGRLNVQCYNQSNGSRNGADEAKLVGVWQAMGGGTSSWSTWPGLASYHEPTNRVFLTHAGNSTTYCHDFNLGGPCSTVSAVTSAGVFGTAQTYGYTTEGNCLVGLGHNSVFVSMKPDLSGPCEGSATSVDITPCQCGGEVVWPPVGIIGSEQLSEFGVRVLDPAGNQLIPDPDGDDEWFDILNNELDLSEISTDHPYITIEMTVTPNDGVDPWVGPEPPAFSVGITDRRPALTN